jgi:hypothetical protein
VTEDVLARLADEIDAHAMISTRPGQLADLERIASELRQFNARLAEHRRSWSMITVLNPESWQTVPGSNCLAVPLDEPPARAVLPGVDGT